MRTPPPPPPADGYIDQRTGARRRVPLRDQQQQCRPPPPPHQAHRRPGCPRLRRPRVFFSVFPPRRYPPVISHTAARTRATRPCATHPCRVRAGRRIILQPTFRVHHRDDTAWACTARQMQIGGAAMIWNLFQYSNLSHPHFPRGFGSYRSVAPRASTLSVDFFFYKFFSLQMFLIKRNSAYVPYYTDCVLGLQ